MNDLLNELLPYLISVVSAITSFIVAFFRTRTNAIKKKVDQSLTLSDYYITIDGKDYLLSDLNIKKKK